LQKCHAKGQKLKLHKMKVCKMVNIFNFERKQPMRFEVRLFLNMQQLFYGMTYLMILEKFPILIKLRIF
jgi:hypothetical protein